LARASRARGSPVARRGWRGRRRARARLVPAARDRRRRDGRADPDPARRDVRYTPDMGDPHELIYDWNSVEKVSPLSPKRRIQFLDETLRDGIQSPSVVDPSIDDKLRLVDLANDLGIDTMDIGLPGAGKRAIEDVTTIAEHIKAGK